MPTIFQRLKRVVTDRLGVAEDLVVPTASFSRDLDTDSIELVELALSIEEEFSDSSREIEIPDEVLEKILTIQDAVDYLRGQGIRDA